MLPFLSNLPACDPAARLISQCGYHSPIKERKEGKEMCRRLYCDAGNTILCHAIILQL
jgi:hypothetical protein